MDTLQNIHQTSPNVGDQRLPINSSPPVSTLALWCPHRKGNTTALSEASKSRQRLGSEPAQAMSYCTWGSEAADSVPKGSAPTHSPRSYQSSATATIPAVTGATASPALTALHGPQTKQNHLFAVRLIWALPLPLFYFSDSCFSLIKCFLSLLIHSQQHWTQRIMFKGSHCSGPKTKSALIFTSGMLLCEFGKVQEKILQGSVRVTNNKPQCCKNLSAAWFLHITKGMLIIAEVFSKYLLRLFKRGHKFRNKYLIPLLGINVL